MSNSGRTPSGIHYPVAGIDEFTPAPDIQDAMESVDSILATQLTTGLAAKQDRLNRTVRTNLASTTAATDTGGNITPGVTGTLPIANGGTGATSAAAARTGLDVPARADLPRAGASTTVQCPALAPGQRHWHQVRFTPSFAEVPVVVATNSSTSKNESVQSITVNQCNVHCVNRTSTGAGASHLNVVASLPSGGISVGDSNPQASDDNDRLPRFASGTIACSGLSQDATHTHQITFPAGRFDTAPVVNAANTSTSKSSGAQAVTATGFNLACRGTNPTGSPDSNATWIALG